MQRELRSIVLENILESIPIGLIVISPDGDILLTNRASCSILGYSRGVFEGKGWGEIFFDSSKNIEFNQVMRASSVRLDWGGKGFNVARALRALGEPCHAMGLIGGATGQLLARGLRDLDITTDFVSIAGETRSNIVIEEEKAGRHIKVNESGPQVSAEDLKAMRSQMGTLAAPNTWWILAGSLPPGVPAGLYAELIQLLKGQGAWVVLDTSGEPLRLGCAAGPYLVKPNAEEATEVTGQPIDEPKDALAAAAALLRQGPVLVALSMGALGLVLASREQAIWARPPAVAARTPVGVGDALLAGMVWAMARQFPMAEVARWGVAAGSAAAMLEGVGVARMAEIQAMYKRISVEHLAPS